MAEIAKHYVGIYGDNKDLEKSLGKAEKSLQAFGKKAENVGKNMSLFLTAPLAALGAKAVSNFNKQAQAVGQLDTALKSTGNSVGFTSKELQKMASDLQKTTLFGDEEILQGATNQLLTFTNIAGGQFARTQQAALDLSTRLGGDLQSASIQLGKALNDPVANLSALSRSGIQFSESQKEVIKELANTNRLADAQNIILDELQVQYGGSAAAAAKLGTGPLKQLSNQFSDLLEDIGAILIEGLAPLIKIASSAISVFQGFTDTTKTVIVVVTSVVAAIGPMLFIFGKIVALLPVMKAGFSAVALAVGGISWPVVAVVGAIAALSAALIYVLDNWEAIVERVSDWSWWKNMIIDMAAFFVEYNTFGLIIKAYNELRALFGGDPIKNPFETWADELKGLKDETKEYEHTFGSFGDAVTNAMNKAKSSLGIGWESQGMGGGASVGVGSGSGSSQGGGMGQGMIPQLDKLKMKLIEIQNIVEPVKQSLHDMVVNGIPDDAMKHKQGLIDELTAKMHVLNETAVLVGNAVGDAFWKMGNNFVNSLGLAETGLQGFLKVMAQTAIELIAMALSQSIANAIVGGSAAGAATGLAAPVTTPAFIATLVGGVLSAFASIPKFATGGVVGGTSFSGDSQTVRVNSGEMILNTSQQNRMLSMLNGSGSASGGDVRFRIEGSSLIGVLDRENRIRRGAQ